jgi:hypothetical protein
MKRLLLTGLLVASTAGISVRADALLYAIESHDVAQVKAILAHQQHLGHEYKRQLKKTAQRAVRKAKVKIDFITSPKDFLKLVLGVSMSGIAAWGLFESNKDLDNSRTEMDQVSGITGLAGSSVLGTVGILLAYKGWTLSAAHLRIEKAKEIRELIQQACT